MSELTFSFRIQEQHAIIKNSGSKVTMEPVKGAKIYVNGIKLKAKQELCHLVTKNCYRKVSLLVIVTKATYCLINEGEVENPIQ